MALPLIAITMGDPTGIGPEIIVKALSTDRPFRLCRPLVFGDEGVISKTIENLRSSCKVQPVTSAPREGYAPGTIFLYPVTRLTGPLSPGKPDVACGAAMARYVEEAVKWTMDGTLDGITTCPISKEAINAAGYAFSGHTELLAHLVQAPSVAMLFLGSRWRVVFVTTHLSLREVPEAITKDRVLSKLRLVNQALREYFGIESPRIAVLGLNPHCGEGGLLGREEEEQIIPAILEAKSAGIEALGPFPADSFFNLASRSAHDAVLAMYHDQGLIAIKTIDFKEAVNVTLGLPFIRTSVGHGTAYDIVGTGTADPTGLLEALSASAKLSETKRKYHGSPVGCS